MSQECKHNKPRSQRYLTRHLTPHMLEPDVKSVMCCVFLCEDCGSIYTTGIEVLRGYLPDGTMPAELAKISEQRLGMSSLGLHGAAHMAPFMPQPMQDVGTSMHHAASRLAIVLQDTSVSPTLDTMRDVNRALHEVTTSCTSCHAGYRIR